MDIKHYILSVLLFVFIFWGCFTSKDINRHQEKTLRLTIVADKKNCSRFDDEVNLKLTLETTRIRPVCIYKSMGIYTEMVDEEMIYIEITKNNTRYRQTEVMYKRPLNDKFLLSKFHPYKRDYTIRFKDLIEKNKADSLMKRKIFNFSNNNEHFGIYKIQAKYISAKRDTIYSKPLFINYVDSTLP